MTSSEGAEGELHLENHAEITSGLVSNRILGKEKTHMGKESAKINQYFKHVFQTAGKFAFLKHWRSQ